MRNYKVKQVNKGLLLQCPSCNKKYKTEIKRQQHVEKDHYYETRNSNRFKFTSEEKARIYKSAGSYIVELYEIRKDEDYGESLAKNLLPQLYKEDLSPNDLKRIMSAQRSFATNLLDQNLLSCDWIAVMDDFEKFFNMGLPHYDTNFCPTLAIDFLWHALMQLPELYIEICEKSCIEIMPHCNIDRTPEEDSQRHEYFLKVFQHKFCKMPTSFPSQLEAFSIEDIREVFGNLYKKEFSNKQMPQNPKESVFLQWKADKVSNFGKQIYQAVKNIKSNCIVSWAPSIYPWSKEQYLQDWPKWLNEGYADYIIPQLYRYKIGDYERILKELFSQVPSTLKHKIFPGILTSLGDGYRVDEMIFKQMIALNRQYGYKGEVFFYYETLNQSLRK